MKKGDVSVAPTPDVARVTDEYRMAVLGGEPERAIDLAQKWTAAVASMNNGRYRGDPLVELIGLLWELGHAEDARTLARKSLREYPAWAEDEMFDLRIEIPRLAFITGAIDANEFRRLRHEWIHRRNRAPVETWLGGFAGLPEVGAEMDPPIATGEYAQDWFSMSEESFSRAAIGLIRVGRAVDAIKHADAAERECLAFSPIGYIHAHVAAAKVHDDAGDVTGACERYAALQTFFARSTRSLALRLSTTRMRELSCPQKFQKQ